MRNRNSPAIGITADFDTVPDVDILARGIEESAAELVAAARELVEA